MIILNYLYSETGLFKTVEFHLGLNLILGKYADSERSVNGLGKSTLIRLVDFCLLSSSGDLSYKKHAFLRDHNVVLEFTIGIEKFRVVRCFRTPNTVLFGRTDSPLIEYTRNELKEIFSDKFFLQATYEGAFYNSNWYRNLIRFFIKDDIKRYQQRDPIDFLDYRERKAKLLAFNFYLLEIPNFNLNEYNDAMIRLADRRTARKEIETQIRMDSGKPLSEFRTEMAQSELKIEQLEENLAEFAFLDNYKDIEERLESIARDVSEYLAQYNSLNRLLESYRESYDVRIEIDIDSVHRLYWALNQELGDFIRHSLDEAIEFRKEISKNRRNFLVERERDAQKSLDEVTSKLMELEDRRKRLYSFLEEEGAFDSIRHAYQRLITQKVDFEKNSTKLKQLSEFEIEIAETKTGISELGGKIINDIRESQSYINNLRLLYKEILDNAIFVDESSAGGYLDIRERTKGNGNPVDIVVDIPQVQSLGKYRFGMLAYSLTVFLNIIRSGRNLPYFLIHDGVFHSIAKKTVVNVLNYVYEQSLVSPNFQYIITGNEDEIYISSDEKHLVGDYKFDIDECIIAQYEATPEKMIFQREF